MKLTSNTILITGGASGIGYELTKQLTALGNTILITGRDQAKLDRAKAAFPKIHTFQSDVSDPKAIAALYEKVTKQFPELNILINNAGIMLGNITLTNERRPLYQTEGLFKELPPALQESAFIDRLHGLLEGWFMPRITKNSPSRHLGLKGDFFGEVLHELRPRLEFADYVSHNLRLPSCDDMRDNKAIARIAEGYLKLLFPDLEVTDDQFTEFCVNPALRMRQQIRDELSKIDSEYAWVSIRSIAPDEFQQLHPVVRPSKDAVVTKAEPLSPERPPEPGTVEIKEGQTGISYRKLFGPYLRGARTVTLVDPYLRLDYQIYNLMSFIEVLDTEHGGLTLQVITAAESNEEEVQLSEKLDQLQESATAKKVTFTYSFDRTKHDRLIETDTGWRIALGRGLDIYYRTEGRFSLGFVDQTQRKCKETNIIYTRK